MITLKMGLQRSFVAALALATLPAMGQEARARDRTGVFDYYLLSLSWSPQHCAQNPGDEIQCAGPRKYGFILHGLWPQFERGYPQSCATSEKLPGDVKKSMLDIMPSLQLIAHEWSKHGTCSGLAAKDYFAKSRQAFAAFRTPASYQQPVQQIYVAPGRFKQQVLEANPSLQNDQIAVLCSGRFLQEVRVCLDRNLKARACSSAVRDRCSVPEMIVRPLR